MLVIEEHLYIAYLLLHSLNQKFYATEARLTPQKNTNLFLPCRMSYRPLNSYCLAVCIRPFTGNSTLWWKNYSIFVTPMKITNIVINQFFLCRTIATRQQTALQSSKANNPYRAGNTATKGKTHSYVATELC